MKSFAISKQSPSALSGKFSRKSVVLAASGPSLIARDLEYCRGRAWVMVVNDAWRLASWADVLYAADENWWAYYDGVPAFDGVRWTQNIQAATRWSLQYIESKPRLGLSLDLRYIHRGYNSGYQALNLAVLFGAKKIILLGYDMQSDGARSHFFGSHPQILQQLSTYSAFVAAFKTTIGDLQKAGCTVINCSRQTALDCFPHCDLHDALMGS